MICASYPVRCCAHALFLAAAATLAGCGGGGGGASFASLGASQSPPPINTTPVASAQVDAAGNDRARLVTPQEEQVQGALGVRHHVGGPALREQAARFLRELPSSVHAARVRAACAEP